jgi:hypothetical protein
VRGTALLSEGASPSWLRRRVSGTWPQSSRSCSRASVPRALGPPLLKQMTEDFLRAYNGRRVRVTVSLLKHCLMDA